MKVKFFTNICLAIAFVVFSGCTSMTSKHVLFTDNASKDTKKVEDQIPVRTDLTQYEYKIIPNNRLSILVYNHPELSTRDITSDVAPDRERGLLVGTNGAISLPLIGKIKVAGLTVGEAANLLTNEYSKYIKNAHVTLEVLNKRIFIIGEVSRPGKISIDHETMNLIEAIAEAGDFTDYAKRNSIKVIRGSLSSPKVETIDLTRLDRMVVNDLTLYPNDVVYVEPNAMRTRNLAIAEMLPGVDIVARILGALYTGKTLTNTYMFNVNDTPR